MSGRGDVGSGEPGWGAGRGVARRSEARRGEARQDEVKRGETRQVSRGRIGLLVCVLDGCVLHAVWCVFGPGLRVMTLRVVSEDGIVLLRKTPPTRMRMYAYASTQSACLLSLQCSE